MKTFFDKHEQSVTCMICGKKVPEKEAFYFGRVTESNMVIKCMECYKNAKK